MSRDKDVDSEPLLPPPVKRRRLISLTSSPAMAKVRRMSRRKRAERKKQKERGFSAGGEGQLGKVVTISFLGKSPDSCSVDARSPLRQNRTNNEGQRRRVSKFPSFSPPRGRGEVEAETSVKFCEIFQSSGKKNERCRTYSLRSRIW